MRADQARAGDQLWASRLDGEATTRPCRHLGGDLLLYTVLSAREPDQGLVVLMVQYKIDGGRDGRVFQAGDDVPLVRPGLMSPELEPERNNSGWSGPV